MKIIKNRAFRAMAVGSFIATSLILWYLLRYDYVKSWNLITATTMTEEQFLVFPSSFDHDLKDFVYKNFDVLRVKGKVPVKARKSSDLRFQQDVEYHDHPITLYNSVKNIMGEVSRCTNELLHQFKVRISRAQLLQKNLQPMLAQLLDDIDSGKSHYLRTFSPFFLDSLRQSLKDGSYRLYWYKFTGSSVFLEEYGVHFVISRVVYSERKSRNSPTVSLVYAELYDVNWKEIKCTLAVPSNNVVFDSDEEVLERSQKYATLSFPQFLPIPFMHDIEGTDGKYFGPEDVHITLVKNEAGHEEPMIIYNLLHKTFKDGKPNDENDNGRNTRSMFIGFPFQFQRGKVNVDGKRQPQFDKLIYTKVEELIVKGKERQKTEKNWVPFLDIEERKKYGFDRNIYIVTNWQNFAVLKCDLQGFCESDYEQAVKLDGVGALRGGSQLINLNDIILKSGGPRARSMIPDGRQIWAGFPRAHINDCGCGSLMYRPNFAVVVRDIAPSGERFYKVSHVSSSIGFDIPVTGWDLSKPTEVCEGGSNVLLSNGISLWNVESFTAKNNKVHTKDYMTLMLSVGDYTIHAVHIEGLLDNILNFDDPALFNSSGTAVPLPEVIHEDKLVGYNADNIQCALQLLGEFCRHFAQAFREYSEVAQADLAKFIEGALIPPTL